MKRHRKTGRSHVALGIATGVVAFLLVTAWSQQYAVRKSTAGRSAQLAALVTARQRRTAELERQLADLRRSLDQQARASRHGRLRELEREIDAVARAAGTEPVRGPGIVVQLSDSSAVQRNEAGATDFQIQDVDVQLVVNALWAAGAEAIAVNGQRVIGTTAIRSAGGAILVNYRILTSPYRVEAIGNPQRLDEEFGRSSIARRFRGWVDIYRLGFSVRRSRGLALAAYTGSIRFHYARTSG